MEIRLTIDWPTDEDGFSPADYKRLVAKLAEIDVEILSGPEEVEPGDPA